MKQLSPDTILAVKHSAQRIASIPGCIALGSCDIGTARLEDGQQVYVTWGRNLNRREQAYYHRETCFQPVWISADDGSAELILSDEIAEFYLNVAIQSNS